MKKIGDSLNYLLLLNALIIEKQGGLKNGIYNRSFNWWIGSDDILFALILAAVDSFDK